jgi:hypothetical protein
MTIHNIPEDSTLRNWLAYMHNTEVPFSYAVAGGLCTIGAVVRRNRWVDQFDWRVFPNQPLMLIGPSGIGKDTTINRVLTTIKSVEHVSNVPVVGGKTLEYIQNRLLSMPKPACAVVPAAEMAAFFGKADYQANMLTGFTDMMSNGEAVDISTKGNSQRYDANGRPVGFVQAQVIQQPTITMLAGSTVEWLHKAMPDNTMEGGFLGRFLIVAEELGSKHIPLVKGDKTKQELDTLRAHLDTWNESVKECTLACTKLREVILYDDAEHMYGNWYHNRFKKFSRAVAPYANRSRDMVLRLAMLMAFTRKHYRWIEECDVAFAISLMNSVAERIDRVALPPTPEATVARKIMEMLPATKGQIFHALSERYNGKLVQSALEMLSLSQKTTTGKDGFLHSVEKDD